MKNSKVAALVKKLQLQGINAVICKRPVLVKN